MLFFMAVRTMVRVTTITTSTVHGARAKVTGGRPEKHQFEVPQHGNDRCDRQTADARDADAGLLFRASALVLVIIKDFARPRLTARGPRPGLEIQCFF